MLGSKCSGQPHVVYPFKVLSGRNARIWTARAAGITRRWPSLLGSGSTKRNRSLHGAALHHQSHGAGIWLAGALEIWLQPRGLLSRPRSHGTRTEALPRYGSNRKTLRTRGGTPADFDSIWKYGSPTSSASSVRARHSIWRRKDTAQPDPNAVHGKRLVFQTANPHTTHAHSPLAVQNTHENQIHTHTDLRTHAELTKPATAAPQTH
jgi:hypothetical protein